jgi:hypothetical protein
MSTDSSSEMNDDKEELSQDRRQRRLHQMREYYQKHRDVKRHSIVQEKQHTANGDGGRQKHKQRLQADSSDEFTPTDVVRS